MKFVDVLTYTLAILLLRFISTAKADVTSTTGSFVGQKRQLLPTMPANDPFYIPSVGFEDMEPGSILANRTIIAASLGLVPLPVEVHQLLFRTTAADGKTAIATVTTVFKPLGAATDKFVSFATAEDSAALQCSPSYSYLFLAEQTDLIMTIESLLLQIYISQGYIVASPDYEGPDSAFAAGRLEGMAVLDSMRAVQSFTPLGLSSNPKIFGSGYSGGAIANGWAAALHPTYAKDLNVVGWAIGGTPSNLTGTFTNVDGTIFAGFLPAAIKGLSSPSAYPNLIALIERIATMEGKAAIKFAGEHCAPDDINTSTFAILASPKYFINGDQFLYEPNISQVLQQTLMGLNKNETPKAPILIYHANNDEIIPYANASALVDTYCSHGATVHFTSYCAGGHFTTEILGIVQVIQYISDAFSGNIPSDGTCTRDTVLDSTLDILALGLNLEPISIELLNALGTLGRQDANVKTNVATLKTMTVKS